MRPWAFAFALLLSTAAHGGPWLDRSHAVFLPRELSGKLDAQSRFPLFWWDFLVIEAGDAGRARAACAWLATPEGRALAPRSGCPDLAQFAAPIADWARDLPRRSPMPGEGKIRAAFGDALTKASLPIDRTLLGVLRADPLGSYHELEARAREHLHLKLGMTSGFFHDAESGRWVLPVQLAFPPNESAKTRGFLAALSRGEGAPWEMVGPHASNLENESRVMSDMHAVSLVGGLLTLLLCGAAVIAGRARLLLLFPPVAVSVLFGIAATVLLCGSIHGLTLSFGTGIIGLAVDYGLLAAFNSTRGEGRDSTSARTWRANLFGLLTTLAGLGLLMQSSIPLLRQMMIFSACGLSLAFTLFFAIHRFFPDLLKVEPVAHRPQSSLWKLRLVLTLAAVSVVGALRVRPTLDMAQFNFQSTRSAELAKWIYTRLESRPPMLAVHPDGDLASRQAEHDFAVAEGIPLENSMAYLPAARAQATNLASWRAGFCGGRPPAWLATMPAGERRLFAPYLDTVRCDRLVPLAPDAVPAYLTDFHADGSWVSLWLPLTEEQETKVRHRFPDALSLRDIVMLFPTLLEKELGWMAPWSIALAMGLLLIYFRRIAPSAIALLPFLSGMGVVTLGSWIFGLGFSFVSVIALVMVFGFSFDYGIFATEMGPDAPERTVSAVWSSLTFAAISTVSGFLPMLFCQHRVLRDLGTTLFLGAIGTYLGAIWGVPALMRRVRA